MLPTINFSSLAGVNGTIPSLYSFGWSPPPHPSLLLCLWQFLYSHIWSVLQRNYVHLSRVLSPCSFLLSSSLSYKLSYLPRLSAPDPQLRMSTGFPLPLLWPGNSRELSAFFHVVRLSTRLEAEVCSSGYVSYLWFFSHNAFLFIQKNHSTDCDTWTFSGTIWPSK